MIFSTEDSGVSTLLLSTNETMNLSTTVREYTLRLKASITDYHSVIKQRDFVVEIVDPCPSAIIFIDENNQVLPALPSENVLL